jgi:probable rRNA maturation factor
MKSDPHITYRRKPASLDIPGLESFAELLRTRVARGRSFHCRVANDAELQALNARFRGKDKPTDVLSFPCDSPTAPLRSRRINASTPLQSRDRKRAVGPEPDDVPLGDIAISLDRARAQAREWGHTVEDELRILLLHGVLHLTGLDHETDSGEMKRTELRWRKKLGLPVGLIERAA